MLNVTLFTKEGCGLCEEVKVELARMAAVYPHHLTEIDITQDRDTFARYHYIIPVVQIGRTRLQAPITAAQLKTALATATLDNPAWPSHTHPMSNSKPTEVALFVTCLVDVFFPGIGEDVVWLLRQAGVNATFPAGQTCCGQPPYNAGFHNEAREIAGHFLDVFAGAPAVVTPSGSCATMVKKEFPRLFRDDPERLALAQTIAGRTYELSEFLVRVMGTTDFGARWTGRATYSDACHMSRELGITAEPRVLLAQVEELELVEMEGAPWCCGFGGAFAAKQPAISGAMLNEKIRRIEAAGVDAVITSDTGCIMHIAGGLQRQNKQIQVLHLAQVLSGRTIQ